MGDSKQMAPSVPSPGSTEKLRLILETEWHRSVTTEEAEEIGRGLISLFENLLDNSLGYGRKKKVV